MERSPRLDRYKEIVGASLIDQIYEVARSLAGLRVLHINTTAQGGGVAEFCPWMRPALWFSHVDTAQPNPSAQQYIQQFLDPYAIVVFNSQPSVFKNLPPEKVQVVTLGIDPFRIKNRFLPKARGMELLTRCGIDTTHPLITQVSRFGIWKNPWQVIDIYRLVKQHMPSVQLALVGALEAKDDVKAVEILTDLQQNYVHGDPDIHLLADPTLIDQDRQAALLISNNDPGLPTSAGPRTCQCS